MIVGMFLCLILAVIIIAMAVLLVWGINKVIGYIIGRHVGW